MLCIKIINMNIFLFFKSILGILQKWSVSLPRCFHKIQLTVTINCFWGKRNEANKKIYILKVTDFFQIHNSQILVVCPVHHLLLLFATLLVFSWLSYRTCSQLALGFADITTLFSISSQPVLQFKSLEKRFRSSGP